MKDLDTRTGALALALAGTLAVSGCGSGDSATPAGGGHDMGSMQRTTTTAATPAAVDRAFVAQMIPHHEMAVEMARQATARGGRPQIRALGASIVAGQAPEITQTKAIAERLGVTPAAMPTDGASSDHGSMSAAAATLGLSMDEMGMSMQAKALESARPFDRAFIDEMVPHHQGAIRMARAELAKGGDPELQAIATAIAAAQKREIERMNAWRTRWYGRPSPAGGVPPV